MAIRTEWEGAYARLIVNQQKLSEKFPWTITPKIADTHSQTSCPASEGFWDIHPIRHKATLKHRDPSGYEREQVPVVQEFMEQPCPGN